MKAYDVLKRYAAGNIFLNFLCHFLMKRKKKGKKNRKKQKNRLYKKK
jgi:hypothetical protein